MTTRKNSPKAPQEILSIKQLQAQALPRLERRAEGKEKPIPLPWSHVAPQFGGGLWPGLHILIGGTGAGKTQWALQLAVHVARQGTPALYIALELGELDLYARLVGLEAKQPWSKLYLGQETKEHLQQTTAKAGLLELPLYFSMGDPGAWAYDQITHTTQLIREKHPEAKDEAGKRVRGSAPLLVVLDFLQLVGDKEEGRPLELREKISKASYYARQVAKELDATVLLISSTARAHYQKTNGAIEEAGIGYDPDTNLGIIKYPDALIGLGKESGDIEFSADTVTVLCRWPEALPEDKELKEGKTAMLLATAKQRPGPATWSELRFNGSRFSAPSDKGLALQAALTDKKPTPTTKTKVTPIKREPPPSLPSLLPPRPKVVEPYKPMGDDL